MKKSFFFLFAFVLLGCNSNEILNPGSIDTGKLKKHWVHSREEETDSVQIYRPVDYKEFPASRYREVYSFEDNSKCEYLVLAPDDAHFFENGTWTYNQDTQTLIIYNSSQEIIKRFRVISVTNDLFKFVLIK